MGLGFLSTPSARRATFIIYLRSVLRWISIHALREEGDYLSSSRALLPTNFYPRPPRGGRLTSAFLSRTTSNFYPRPPRGGRRRHDMADIAASGFLSTPSARRATLRLRQSPGVVVISIHALREEGDSIRKPRFQQYAISIHALREEGDAVARSTASRSMYFYPRPPRGGRRSKERHMEKVRLFLSTPSARRATLPLLVISALSGYFYPRPPRGGRQVSSMTIGERVKISIHALREEGDACGSSTASSAPYFYPRPPRGGRP